VKQVIKWVKIGKKSEFAFLPYRKFCKRKKSMKKRLGKAQKYSPVNLPKDLF